MIHKSARVGVQEGYKNYLCWGFQGARSENKNNNFNCKATIIHQNLNAVFIIVLHNCRNFVGLNEKCLLLTHCCGSLEIEAVSGCESTYPLHPFNPISSHLLVFGNPRTVMWSVML